MIIRSLMMYLLLLVIYPCFSQEGIVSGRVTSEDTSPIFGANIFIEGIQKGAISDNDGYFTITNLPDGNYTLIITFIGYNQEVRSVEIVKGSSVDLPDIVLYEVVIQYAPTIITASKYEQNIKEIPLSIGCIDQEEMDYRNNLTIDGALKYVSGINMNSEQVSIRGSNGFSKGVGSRVMMLVDGVPYITGDTQGLIFEAIPVNHIERVEIIKGAGSALYGSSAIGGVINIITKAISEEPEFHYKMYGGLYSKPYYSEWKWSNKNQYLRGIGVDYSNKSNKLGYRFAASWDEDDSYMKNNWRERYNVSGKIEYDLSQKSNLQISGNYLYMNRGNFLYWQSLNNALIPPFDQMDDEVTSKRSFLTTSYRKTIDENQLYKINAIWYHNYFIDNIGFGSTSNSDYFNAEFQFNKLIDKHYFVFGVTPTYNQMNSDIFGTNYGIGLAMYIQDEIKWNEKWITTLGARMDYSYIDKLGDDIQFNPKTGIVYKPNELNSFRTSLGTGYRTPSMAEYFTNTEAGGIPVLPNEMLKPEKSISTEIGWNKNITEGCIVDLSLFYNRYWDLIEGGFQTEGGDMFIQFDNVTNAQILGIECNMNWRIIKDRLHFNTGYTRIESKDLNAKTYLKYRPKDLMYSGIKFNYKKIQFGTDYRYISRFDNIDENFNFYIEDADERNATHVVDLHLSVDLKVYKHPLSVSAHVNNLLQYHYVEFVGVIAPLRHFLLSIEMGL